MTRKQKAALAITDFLLVWFSLFLSVGLRLDFDFELMARFLDNQLWFAAVSAVSVVIFYLFGLYDRVWRYAGIRELIELVVAVTVSLLPFQFLAVLSGGFIFPRTGPILTWLLVIPMVGGARLTLRLASERATRSLHRVRVLIVGANDGGESVLRDLSRADSGHQVVGFVDEKSQLAAASIRGVPILGSLAELPGLVSQHEVEELVLAQLTPGQTSEVVRLTEGLELRLKIVPAATELVAGHVQVSRLRELRIEDLLERETIPLEPERIASYLQGKRVLVTGAGGSIGAEICRQVLDFKPATVVLLGRGENSIHELLVELAGKPVQSSICDVRNRAGMRAVFERVKPEVVFHAAAHKHVPLMEQDVAEAIANNVFGTLTVMELCKEFQTGKFILLSSDKAVNPTSVMGATKRMCELLLAKNPGPGFAAVRFGNVLGSRGSVIPTFRSQIESGGPVTVTDPEMSRFFMTIPEAVALVLQAGSMARGGEIYVLDMGNPVRIVDLARNLIRLSGYEPDRDIEIQFIGVRQGEKMHEELTNVGEDVEATEAAKIQRVTSPPPEGDWPGPSLEAMREAAQACDDRRSLALLAQLVKNFHPQHEGRLSQI
ncbi:MAG: polysaccharide biosynthesis protein [Vulcanimicrobiota bacterium]